MLVVWIYEFASNLFVSFKLSSVPSLGLEPGSFGLCQRGEAQSLASSSPHPAATARLESSLVTHVASRPLSATEILSADPLVRVEGPPSHVHTRKLVLGNRLGDFHWPYFVLLVASDGTSIFISIPCPVPRFPQHGLQSLRYGEPGNLRATARPAHPCPQYQRHQLKRHKDRLRHKYSFWPWGLAPT